MVWVGGIHNARNKLYVIYNVQIFTCGAAGQFLFLRFLDHTQRRTTVGRTPLEESAAGRRDLCLTTHNTHNRQTSMPTAVFEPTISAGERPQTYALDRAATRTGMMECCGAPRCRRSFEMRMNRG